MTKSADTTLSLHDYLQHRRREIEDGLRRFLPQAPQVPAVVASAIHYSVMAGGKRLRPLLTLAASDAVASRSGIDVEQARAWALPAACAIEMIHTYSLIHDDLPAMDDDVLRRGRPTLHVIAGDGMAILAGDGLQAVAFQVLADHPFVVHGPRRTVHGSQPTVHGLQSTVQANLSEADGALLDARKLRVLSLVAAASGPAGMVGGQAIDLAAIRPAPGQPPNPITATDLEDMHARKTGALIRASAVAGAIMAGAESHVTDAIDRYGAAVGLAFQIVDDLLDIEAASDVLGKTAGKDAAAGKPTYPALYGVARSRQLAAECLAKAERALEEADLQSTHLSGIARWIIERSS